jgi:hypothetical protein
MPTCAEASCARWRPERLAPRWATGIRLNDDWYCSRACVLTAAKAGLHGAPPAPPEPQPRRLGALLRHLNAVSESDLRAALESQPASRRRLGAELMHRGHVSPDVVLRALAAQAGVSYLASFDVSRVRRGPSWLPRETVRALGLVPFALDRENQLVHVMSAAPVPRAAVRALQRLTGWTPEVFLVHDAVWELALRQYRHSESSDSPFITVAGLDDAAALVADTASTDRAVTMRHARWDRYTWVQVAGPTQVSNVLVPAMEGTWQVAPTPQ